MPTKRLPLTSQCRIVIVLHLFVLLTIYTEGDLVHIYYVFLFSGIIGQTLDCQAVLEGVEGGRERNNLIKAIIDYQHT